jgi:hypothetical protein
MIISIISKFHCDLCSSHVEDCAMSSFDILICYDIMMIWFNNNF